MRTPNFQNVRRLASSMIPSRQVRRLGEDPFSASEWKSIIDQGFNDAGAFSLPSAPSLPGMEDDANERTPNQKRLDTLKERLEASGHEVPESEDEGRQGFVGWLLNALGAPGGAVTTLVHDAVDGGDFNAWESLRKGWTGEERKIGSDILDELGVENKWARGIGGFLTDIALDPTSYIGVGLVRNVGTAATREAAEQAIRRTGQQVSSRELDTIIEHAVGPSARGAASTNDPRIAAVAQELGRPVKMRARTDGGPAYYELSEVAPRLPTQVNLEVGIPFTSRQLKIADLTPAFQRAGDAFRRMPTSNNPVIRSIGRIGERTGNVVRKMFSSYNLPPEVANLFRQRQMKINHGSKIGVQTGIKIDQLLGNYRGNEEIHRAMAYALDTPSASKDFLNNIPPQHRKQVEQAFDLAKKELDEIAQREVRAGVLNPDKVREFYFPHLLDGDRRAIEAAHAQLFGQDGSRLRTTGRFQQERTFDTLRELEEFVAIFNRERPELGKLKVNYNIGQVVATRRLASETLLQNKKLIDNLKNLGHQFIKPLKDGLHAEPGYVKLADTFPELRNYMVQEDVANFLINWNKISRPGGELNDLVRLWDLSMRIFKTSATATPGFHVRNFLGSIWNNWVMGAKNPQDYVNAAHMVLGGRARRLEPNREALNRVQVDLPDGRTISGEEVLRLAQQYDLLHAGWMGDLGMLTVDEIGKRSGFRKAIRLGHFKEFGEATEDVARLAGFMDQLRKTGDPYASALNVKKHLFDYSELSNFEKTFMRRLIPFYTWMRKNVPLQLEALITRPGMYTGLAHAQEEGAALSGIDLDEMPDWLANSAMIPLGETGEGFTRYLNQFALPANDIFELLRGMQNPQEFLRYIGQQTAPHVRMFAEYPLNKQFFTGEPIDRDAQQTGGSISREDFINYLFSQTGLPYNVFRSLAGRRELLRPPGEEDRSDDEFIARNLPPFDPEQPLGLAGMFGEYNPEYWQERSLPYRHSQQLQREIRRLTREGETVYTKTEIDQARELGLTPEQVRFFRNMLDEMGLQKSKKNIADLAQQHQ